MAETTIIHGVEIDPTKYQRFVTRFERQNRRTGETTVTDYLGVEGKLALLRDLLVALGYKSTDYSVETLAVTYQGSMVWVSKRLVLPWGHYDSVSGANTEGNDIAAGNPFEVADTSAVGRCIGHAGFDILGRIESAEGMSKAGYNSGAGTRSSGASGQGSSSAQVAPNGPAGTYVCEEAGCGTEITASGQYTAEKNAFFAKRATGRILCYTHRKAAEGR